jgi:YVTN family beta-propeller protein
MRTRALLLALLFTAVSALPVSADALTADTSMVLIKTINGSITPKSVSASGDGTVSAHNMMYRHSVTLYDAATLDLKATIPDKVNLSALGFPQYKGSFQGAPVEGAYSPDGQYLYVTNYAMYGTGFSHEGHDDCKATNPYDRSFLYRINRQSNVIDAAYLVGKVPKVVQVSPDNKWILVTNWCSYDLSVISVESQKVVRTIKIGAYPRGIVIKKDASLAYVAQMGGSTIHEINLKDFSHRTMNIGVNPRALVLSPDESTLYATLNLSGKVVAYDLTKEKVVHSIKTGKATRSLDISSDGSALFVVNFDSGTVSKIRTADFSILQNIKVCNEPIGVTYEPTMNRTWVACYKGQIKVFDNK